MRTAGRISIEAAATWLPPQAQPLGAALAEGRLTEKDVASSGYRSLPVSTDVSAPDMAVLAGRRALASAGRSGHKLDLVVHAWIYHQGHDFWSPAHYVADRIGADTAIPVGVQQMCNGGAAGLEVAATRLLADPSTQACLVTTADRFGEPGFDRWRGDYGVLYGDGAAAAVVTRSAARSDGLDLLAISTVAAAELEAMHRGDRPFSAVPGGTVDVRQTKKAFLATVDKAEFTATVARGVGNAIGIALADADVAPDDPRLRCVLLPRLGHDARENIYAPAIASATPAPCVDIGADTGHLGAGDALANLAALMSRPLLDPGQIAVVLSAGAGFTWTCAVLARPVAGTGDTRGPGSPSDDHRKVPS